MVEVTLKRHVCRDNEQETWRRTAGLPIKLTYS